MSNREDRLPSLHEILHKNRNDYVKSIYENIRSNRSEKLFELIELEIHLEKSCYYNQKKDTRCFEYFFFFFNSITDIKPIDLNWTRSLEGSAIAMISTAKEKKKTAVKRVCFLEVRGTIDTTCITTTTRSPIISRSVRRYAGLELAPLSHRSPEL